MGALLTTIAYNVTVLHVEQSRPLAPRIVEASRASAEFLGPRYGLPPDHPVTVLWLPEANWAEHTSLPYGFPSIGGRRDGSRPCDMAHHLPWSHLMAVRVGPRAPARDDTFRRLLPPSDRL